MREVQECAIEAILHTGASVLIAAATAAGKTEAAFLPLLTETAARATPGLSILYVSPLKALINDQFRRLDELCERLEIDVVRWHGDGLQSAKRRALERPNGVVLITPESIEALLLRRTDDARRLFGRLDAVVIDELHAFLQGPRGLHLASLLHRIDRMADRPARRIGLSATVGDLDAARAWLNPVDPAAVRLVDIAGGAPELRLQIRGYVEGPEPNEAENEVEVDGGDTALDQIADHAFKTLRGDNNLVFGGSRRMVEALADRLRRRAEAHGVPNEFFPHHGSLAKELREELELRLKAADLPTTAIATTTLELGIDIGSVKSVAQLGAPRSLSSLRQRLGRSGRRRGAPATLRIYIREKHAVTAQDPLDRLRPEIVRATASIRLLLQRFVEPPVQDPAIVTVVIHQILSCLVEHGGLRPAPLFDIVCGQGPLNALTRADMASLLRNLAGFGLIEQAPDGTLMLGPEGENLTQGRDFYAIFQSEVEWRLVHAGRTLGTIPIANLLGPGSLVAFAGRRWRVVDVDDRAKVLEVVSHPAGKLPRFDRLSVEPIHDRLAAEMRSVYLDGDVPNYLDNVAAGLLVEGRAAFAEYGLGDTDLIAAGADTHVLLWRGTAMTNVVAVALSAAGLDCEAHDLGVTLPDTTPDEAAQILRQLSRPIDAGALSTFVRTLEEAKYDEFAPTELLRDLWARSNARLIAALPDLVAGLRLPET